jgi:hypothetical protein
MSQSRLLSNNIKTMAAGGRHLNDNSKVSEKVLDSAMIDIIKYAREKAHSYGINIEHRTKVTLYECQEYFHLKKELSGTYKYIPDIENKKVFMKPDGGVLFAVISDTIKIPILIVEDKLQGTNDLKHTNGEKRQATGNAIERGAKNIRGAEMLFASYDIFPYVLFASGCDFHKSETIAKRIEMMNMGIPNHYINIDKETTDELIQNELDRIISNINIKNINDKSISSVFVKAHKWNVLPHGSSVWKKNEIIQICKRVIDLVFEYLHFNKYIPMK